MAEGMLGIGGATVTAAITGVAGPDGGSEDKAVGTVWLAWAMEGKPTRTALRQFSGDRENVRRASVKAALEGLLRILD
jgi:nicotinamide-nucleotide amidase